MKRAVVLRKHCAQDSNDQSSITSSSHNAFSLLVQPAADQARAGIMGVLPLNKATDGQSGVDQGGVRINEHAPGMPVVFQCAVLSLGKGVEQDLGVPIFEMKKLNRNITGEGRPFPIAITEIP